MQQENNIKCIGVVGSGQMGRGIAQVAAMSNFEVYLYDAKSETLPLALEFIQEQLKRGVEKKKWDENFAAATTQRLKITKNIKDFSGCDLVIEAITEDRLIKKELLKNLDNILKPHALLVSNTSSISITELAAATQRPSQVMGMHFMNPVPVMKLVEGIRGLQTSDQTFHQVKTVAEKMGKVFICASDTPGFAVNRILMPMINEAVYAVYEGVATPVDIDQAMKLGTNQPMGPLELADFIGLDTCLFIMNVLHEGLGDSKYRACPLLKNYVAAGRLGKKTKKGFYDY